MQGTSRDVMVQIVLSSLANQRFSRIMACTKTSEWD